MQGGGADKVEKQHQQGKQTARERIDLMVDEGSFEETGLFAEHRSTLFGMADKTFPADGVFEAQRTHHLANPDIPAIRDNH